MGTIDYISRKQISGQPAMPASDISAFSAILCEALTGEVPFPLDSEEAALFAHVSREPPLVSSVWPDLAGHAARARNRAAFATPGCPRSELPTKGVG